MITEEQVIKALECDTHMQYKLPNPPMWLRLFIANGYFTQTEAVNANDVTQGKRMCGILKIGKTSAVIAVQKWMEKGGQNNG